MKAKGEARSGVLRDLWARQKARLLSLGWHLWGSPQELVEAANLGNATERYQVEKRTTRFSYAHGPMYYLAQHIVKGMEDAGYPVIVHELYRGPARQEELYAKGRTSPGKRVTNARAYQSSHQLLEGVDLIHPKLGWNTSPDYWQTLSGVVETVALKFGVVLDHGHHWKNPDSAHVEIADWRRWREELQTRHGENRKPSLEELWERFHDVLPGVAQRYEAEHHGPPHVVRDERADKLSGFDRAA